MLLRNKGLRSIQLFMEKTVEYHRQIDKQIDRQTDRQTDVNYIEFLNLGQFLIHGSILFIDKSFTD
jgi:heme oxygenase